MIKENNFWTKCGETKPNNDIEFLVILCVNHWWLKRKCDKRIIQFVWIESISLHSRFRFEKEKNDGKIEQIFDKNVQIIELNNMESIVNLN